MQVTAPKVIAPSISPGPGPSHSSIPGDDQLNEYEENVGTLSKLMQVCHTILCLNLQGHRWVLFQGAIALINGSPPPPPTPIPQLPVV